MKRLLIIVPILLLVMLGACNDAELNPHVGTLVAQTQTALAWTPTPIVTAVPNQVLIIQTLNGGIRGVDDLDEAIDATFKVADIAFESYRNSPVTNLLRVQVECEWVSKPSCTAERAFVVFVHAFAGKKIRPKIIKEIPATITIIQIKALDHLVAIGTIEIDLADLSAYLDGHITCDQLVARMRRTNP